MSEFDDYDELFELRTSVALGILDAFNQVIKSPDTAKFNITVLPETDEVEFLENGAGQKEKERQASISGYFHVEDTQGKSFARVYVMLQWHKNFPDDFAMARINYVSVELGDRRCEFSSHKGNLGLLEHEEAAIKQVMEHLKG